MTVNYLIMDNRIRLEKQHKPIDQVTELILDNCQATQISGLSDEFVNLETLSIINVGLATLKGFPRLPNLKRLALCDNKLSDGLNYLLGSQKLQELNLSGNNFRDLSSLEPLRGLKELTCLDIYNCDIARFGDYKQKVFDLLPNLQLLDSFDRDCNREPEPNIVSEPAIIMEGGTSNKESTHPVSGVSEPEATKPPPKEPDVAQQEPDVAQQEPNININTVNQDSNGEQVSVDQEFSSGDKQKVFDLLPNSQLLDSFDRDCNREPEPNIVSEPAIIMEGCTSNKESTHPVSGVSEPEATKPPPKEPDVAQQEPDVAQQEPDVAQQEPDVAQQEPDVAQQEPDVAQQEPNIDINTANQDSNGEQVSIDQEFSSSDNSGGQDSIVELSVEHDSSYDERIVDEGESPEGLSHDEDDEDDDEEEEEDLSEDSEYDYVDRNELEEGECIDGGEEDDEDEEEDDGEEEGAHNGIEASINNETIEISIEDNEEGDVDIQEEPQQQKDEEEDDGE